MPSAWTLIDTSFPVFTGKERTRDQIPLILNYMYLLSEGLKYQLSNLNNSNWNSSALDNLKLETTADLVKQMTSATEEISGILNRLNSLSASILQLEQDIGTSERWQAEADRTMEDLDDRLADAEGTLMALEEVLQTDGDGGATVGSEGKILNLVGNVYLNGKLLTVGGTTNAVT